MTDEKTNTTAQAVLGTKPNPAAEIIMEATLTFMEPAIFGVTKHWSDTAHSDVKRGVVAFINEAVSRTQNFVRFTPTKVDNHILEIMRKVRDIIDDTRR